MNAIQVLSSPIWMNKFIFINVSTPISSIRIIWMLPQFFPIYVEFSSLKFLRKCFVSDWPVLCVTHHNKQTVWYIRCCASLEKSFKIVFSSGEVNWGVCFSENGENGRWFSWVKKIELLEKLCKKWKAKWITGIYMKEKNCSIETVKVI